MSVGSARERRGETEEPEGGLEKQQEVGDAGRGWEIWRDAGKAKVMLDWGGLRETKRGWKSWRIGWESWREIGRP